MLDNLKQNYNSRIFKFLFLNLMKYHGYIPIIKQHQSQYFISILLREKTQISSNNQQFVNFQRIFLNYQKAWNQLI